MRVRLDNYPGVLQTLQAARKRAEEREQAHYMEVARGSFSLMLERRGLPEDLEPIPGARSSENIHYHIGDPQGISGRDAARLNRFVEQELISVITGTDFASLTPSQKETKEKD